MHRPGFLLRAAGLYAVAAIGAFAQSGLTVVPQQVTLAAPAGSTRPAVQSVTIAASTQLPYEASIRYLGTGSDWLSVTPTTGNMPAILKLSADASRLGPGLYSSQVTIMGDSNRIGGFVTVLFSVGPASGTGPFAVSPSSLTFFGSPGSDSIPSQTLSVRNLDGSDAATEFKAFATSDGNWLSVSPMSAVTPGTMTISATQAGLLAGSYSGTITLTPASGGEPTVVPVVLVATGTSAESANLVLSQSSLAIRHQLGTTAPSPQIIQVAVSGASPPAFQAGTTTPWLKLASTFNSTPTTSLTEFLPGELAVRVDPAGLAPGAYTGSVTIAAPGVAPQQLPVSLTVTTSLNLNAYPSSILFDSEIRTTTIVAVMSTDGSNATIRANVSGAPWLSVTPATSVLVQGLQVLTVTANPNGLTAGTYTGTVNITIQDSTTSIPIPVQLEVSGSTATPTALEISTTAIEFNGLSGREIPSQTIDVRTTPGGVEHLFTAAASSTGGWLSVDPFLGGAPARVTVRANSGLPPVGDHEGMITITSLVTGAAHTIPVTLTLAQPAITATPAELTFVQQTRGAPPPLQRIEVTANAPSTYTVTTSAPWIKADLARGATPSSVGIVTDPAGLPPGINKGSVVITGPSNQLTIPVSFTVLEPSAPTATPNSIAFTYQIGNPAPAAQPITIGSTGDPVPFKASAKTESGVDWLVISAQSGSTPTTLMATLNTSIVVPGEDQGSITITREDGSAPTIIPVTLNATASRITVATILHGASLAPTAIAPGQIVTITGTGLGPVSGVIARPNAAGTFETRLADIRVLFDGIPAPLLFVRNDQINAIAPYALQGRASSRLQVESGTRFSVPVEARIVDAAPGIFTAGGVGRGQAAAINLDFSLNSPAQPAPRGSVITVFGTGEGQTDPPGQDGRVILTDLRRPHLPVTAKIGGRPAEVTYFGSAPTLVSGVFQANIRIPEDIEAGVVALEIQVGSATIQPGVTIIVR